MNREPLYKKTVDILFQAYFADTLERGNCCACAVGNIVAANNEYKFIVRKNDPFMKWEWEGKEYPGTCAGRPTGWGAVFSTSGRVQKINEEFFTGEPRRQILSTGYSMQELALIENAFETAKRAETKEENMFNGLCAVLEVLKQIHGIDDNHSEVSRFRNHYNSKLQTV